MSLKWYSLLFLNLIFSTGIFGQGGGDTNRANRLDLLRTRAKEEQASSASKFNQDKIERKQLDLIREIRNTTLNAREYVRVGLDTLGLNRELKDVDRWFPVITQGIFQYDSSKQTYRNLEASARILDILLEGMLTRKTSLDVYTRRLNDFKSRIDSLNVDSALYIIPSDSLALKRYIQRVLILSEQIRPADSAFNSALVSIQDLQNRVDVAANKLSYGLEQVKLLERQLYSNPLAKDIGGFSSTGKSGKTFLEALSSSWAKARLGTGFYVKNNRIKIVVLAILIMLSALFLRNLRRQFLIRNPTDFGPSSQLVLRHPLLSALLIVCSVFQFLFSNPPSLFSTILWTISSLSLTVIFRGFISRFWMKVWLALVILFLSGSLDNLVLESSYEERWIMAILAISGVALGIYALNKGAGSELKEKWILYFLVAVVIMEGASLVLNYTGRYNFSKALMITGYINVIVGILLLWTVRLINEGLSIAAKLYERPDKALFYINFDRLGGRAPRLFYIFLLLGWIILIGRNFYSFQLIAEPIRDFLWRERAIGEYNFTVYGILIFFLILLIAIITSRVVSFFAGDKHSNIHFEKDKGKVGLGSWLLLIRISIIATGIFLAFAAVGIPMDRLTIVIGALGVGIGFGLQTLINNLVSGLIIAFEKPVNVGDVVEIRNQLGTMKSIGFRSSVISRFEGADLVVPNGDLLNEHLVNWTLNGSRRRFELSVGVAYGTNLNQTKQILNDVLGNVEPILKNPPPEILIKEFGNSSIDFQLFFWVRDVSQWLTIKGKVMYLIEAAFKEHEIRIPFSQQDLHIVSYLNAEESKKVKDTFSKDSEQQF